MPVLESPEVIPPVDSSPPASKLVLSWGDRETIMQTLNRCSLLLFRATFSNDGSKEMLPKINDLVARLINLKSSDTKSGQSESGCQSDQSDGQSGDQNSDQSGDKRDRQNDQIENERPKKKQRVNENGESRPTTLLQPFFELPMDLRKQVVNQLFLNLNAIAYHTLGTNDAKKRLAEENAGVNIQLLSLPIKTSHELDPLEDDPPTYREIASEITMDMELPNVAAFFRSKSERVSQIFTCRRCPFSIRLEVTEMRDRIGRAFKYLGFFLECWQDFSTISSVSTIFDIRLLDPVSETVVKEQRYSHLFTSRCYLGSEFFIKYDDLQSKNYIHNDRLKVQVYLWSDGPTKKAKNLDHSNRTK